MLLLPSNYESVNGNANTMCDHVIMVLRTTIVLLVHLPCQQRNFNCKYYTTYPLQYLQYTLFEDYARD